MWFTGASWWTLFAAGLICIGAFWFAARAEDRRRRDSRRDQELSEYLTALTRIYGRQPR